MTALARFSSGFVQRRIASKSAGNEVPPKLPTNVIAGFVGELIYGALLATSFAKGYEDITLYLFQGLFVVALLLPIYRAGCLLGFVLGMTFTFGTVLPTGISLIFVILSAVAHLLVHPLLVHG